MIRLSFGAVNLVAPLIAKASSVMVETITAAASPHGMAGGGIQGGVSYGETDEFVYNIASDPVHIRDLNATMLHCLGIDHERFTYRFQGLDQRLTGVEEAHVIDKILA